MGVHSISPAAADQVPLWDVTDSPELSSEDERRVSVLLFLAPQKQYSSRGRRCCLLLLIKYDSTLKL